jgi:type VI secretion system protein ImpC
MTGRLQFQFDLTPAGKGRKRDNPRRRILVLGDFSGDRPDKPALSERKPWRVDSDAIESLPGRAGARLRLALGEGGAQETVLNFDALDDFHPDALYRRLPIFQELRDMRARLENPKTYADAVEELERGTLGPAPALQPSASTANAENDAETFQRLLGGSIPSPDLPTQRHADPVQNLVRALAEPHLNKTPDLSLQKSFLSIVDDAIALTMRELLRHPRLQALEAVWRGCGWLVDRVENDEDIRIFLLDASHDELAQDLATAEGIVERTALYRLLTESSLAVPGGEPWSLTIGQYAFGARADDLGLLELLGLVCARCGGVFIAGASPRLLGCDALDAAPDAAAWPPPDAGLAQAWQNLRRAPAARFIGLALPRFMLRMPYGRKSNPVDSFLFEEMPSRPVHAAYLWGAPALACAEAVARAWLAGEDPASPTEIESLPYHVQNDGDDPVVKPCAEVYLNEKTAHAMLDAGLVPLLSIRNQNRALLPRLQSIAQPAAELAGI